MNRNQSEWRVGHKAVGGTTYICVYRLRDMDAIDHSGNREYYEGFFDSDKQAEYFARELNRMERRKV